MRGQAMPKEQVGEFERLWAARRWGRGADLSPCFRAEGCGTGTLIYAAIQCGESIFASSLSALMRSRSSGEQLLGADFQR